MLNRLKDVIVFPEDQGRWVLMNVFAKTCLGIEPDSLTLLNALAVENLSESHPLIKARYRTWEIGFFSNEDGLLADPTRYRRNSEFWGNPLSLTGEELKNLFLKSFFLVEDEATYRARFQEKNSLLDRDHFGNFHQQLGQHLMLDRREDPEMWWVRQKFTEDLKGVRNNLYGAIQADFLKQYFQMKFAHHPSVIDVGCGTGFYAHLMAAGGAQVLGLDPNEKFLEIARSHISQNAKFEKLQLNQEPMLASVPSASADFVFMSDALLFYFVPPTKGPKADIQKLLSEIKRILKPGGTFISLEPHYLFWLLPWLGDVRHPFTVLTEYTRKTFQVTAMTSQLIQAWSKGGFAVSWMEELLPEASFEAVDPRAYHFAKQFPLWQLYELRPLL